MWKRTIGVVGGLGPHAHLELERLLLRAAECRIGRAATDQDYPPWLLASVSGTPDRTAALHGGPSPLDSLIHALRWLAGAGSETRAADFAVIACNAAHAWFDDLRRGSELPLLDVPAEALRAAVDRAGAGASIGILGTTATIEGAVYPRAAQRTGLDVELVTLLDPGTQTGTVRRAHEDLVMTPIYGPIEDGRRAGGIKAGRIEAAGAPLRQAVRLLRERGARVVILGCTEIPLALGRDPIDGVPLVDSMAAAAEAAVAIAAGDRALP